MSDQTLPRWEMATGFTRELLTKLRQSTEARLLKSDVFVPALTDDLDNFIETAGSDLCDQFVALAERRFQAFIGCYRIPVNYDAPNAVQAAIDANAFGYKYVYTDAGNIPLGGTGEATEMVREVHFGKVMYNRDLPEALKKKGQEDYFKNGYMFANPLTALLFALKNPEVQRDHPLGILCYVGEQMCCLLLGLRGYGRGLKVSKSYPGDYWSGDTRFLVVSAPAVSAQV